MMAATGQPHYKTTGHADAGLRQRAIQRFDAITNAYVEGKTARFCSNLFKVRVV